jgi:hypothetical protein
VRASTTYGQPSTARVSADLQQLNNVLRSIPWLDGREILDVELVGGANTVINHSLGYVPKGWWVTKFSGATAHDYPRQVDATSSSLTLIVTGAATVSLWVF